MKGIDLADSYRQATAALEAAHDLEHTAVQAMYAAQAVAERAGRVRLEAEHELLAYIRDGGES